MESSYFNTKGMKCPYHKKINDSLPMSQKHADKRGAKLSASRKGHSGQHSPGSLEHGEQQWFL